MISRYIITWRGSRHFDSNGVSRWCLGEIENNRKACGMILSKIIDDPQSGSCLNVSYADVSGPVANFNPTGKGKLYAVFAFFCCLRKFHYGL